MSMTNRKLRTAKQIKEEWIKGLPSMLADPITYTLYDTAVLRAHTLLPQTVALFTESIMSKSIYETNLDIARRLAIPHTMLVERLVITIPRDASRADIIQVIKAGHLEFINGCRVLADTSLLSLPQTQLAAKNTAIPMQVRLVHDMADSPIILDHTREFYSILRLNSTVGMLDTPVTLRVALEGLLARSIS
jgi:hypothetical protein